MYQATKYVGLHHIKYVIDPRALSQHLVITWIHL